MLRTIYGDPSATSGSTGPTFPACYFTGDGAAQDKDGYFWIMGRVDDVLNVSGHRLGTMEVESALVTHPKVAEAAVVGRPDEIKGQAIVAFVTLEGGVTAIARAEGRTARTGWPRRSAPWPSPTTSASPSAAQDALRQDHAPPAARIATSGEVKGDTTTLEDFAVITKLKDSDE